MNRLSLSTARIAFALSVGMWMWGSASDANAAFYGNFSDPSGSVDFLNVQDNNGLFGAPTVSGNNLDFSPSNFEADCSTAPSCAPAAHTVTDLLLFEIDARNGYVIDTIVMTEAGDTTLFSIANALAATTVVADVFVDVLEVGGSPVSVLTPINGSGAMVFTPTGAFATNIQGNGTRTWSGLLSLDIDQVIANSGVAVNGQATLVRVSLSNTLTAYAESGATARIQKKDIDGLAITVIPEPGTALLMGFGLMGLASARRRSPRD